MEPGPKMIAGDLNGKLEAFPTAQALLQEYSWTDIGNCSGLCEGKPAQPTCHANAEAKESRIDYILANPSLTPAIRKCTVDQK